jgi:hypothetical protein
MLPVPLLRVKMDGNQAGTFSVTCAGGYVFSLCAAARACALQLCAFVFVLCAVRLLSCAMLCR